MTLLEKRQYILDQLVKSTVHYDAFSFLFCLFSDDVIVQMPNKVVFYEFYKGMLESAKSNSECELFLKIEKYSMDENAMFYNFYDQMHQFSRLTIEVKIINDKIQLEVYPF